MRVSLPLPYRDLKTGGKGDDRALFLPAAKWSGLEFTTRGGLTHLVLNVRGTAAGLWGRRPLLVKGPDRLGAMRKRTRCGGNRALQIALLAQRKMTNHAHPSQRHLDEDRSGGGGGQKVERWRRLYDKHCHCRHGKRERERERRLIENE